MGKRIVSLEDEASPVKRRVARTPEAREAQLISLAVDAAEKQLREGTASSQIIVHYLKMGSKREKLEQEQIKVQTEMYAARTKAYASAEEIKELYTSAMEQMKLYQGNPSPEEPEEDEF